MRCSESPQTACTRSADGDVTASSPPSWPVSTAREPLTSPPREAEQSSIATDAGARQLRHVLRDRELAAAVRVPPARGQPVRSGLAAAPDLLEGALGGGAGDAPRPVLLDVLVGIERGAAQREVATRVHDHVVEGPDARGGRGSRQVDLGMVHAMAREEAGRPHGLPEELEDRVTALERVLAAAVRDDRVGREAFGHLVPELL